MSQSWRWPAACCCRSSRRRPSPQPRSGWPWPPCAPAASPPGRRRPPSRPPPWRWESRRPRRWLLLRYKKDLKPTRAKCNNREFSNKILNHIKLPHIFHSAMKKIYLCYLLHFNVKLTRNVWQVRNSVIALIHWNIRFYIWTSPVLG